MIRIDEMMYLMHELSLLSNQRQGFKVKFLEVSRKEKKDKMMDKFNEFHQTLRYTLMFKQKKTKDTYLRRHKGCVLRLVCC